MVRFVTPLLAVAAAFLAADHAVASTNIKLNNPLIWYHGRWDKDHGTWWAGTGFTLHTKGLSSLSLQLGNHTTQPTVTVGVSVDYGSFTSVNLTTGINDIPLSLNTTSLSAGALKAKTSVIRFHTQGWTNNQLFLEKITLNSGASLLPYTPSKLNFEFIGDSMSVGYELPEVLDQSWTKLTAENFKAELLINAQPGACLTDIVCWGNPHGLEYLYFKTEDSNYWWTTYHNYTTNWDFRKDYPPSHVFVTLGTNDYSFKVPDANLTATFVSFMGKLRKLYPYQPLFLVPAWGWPSENGPTTYYYQDVFPNAVAERQRLGDKHIYLVNTTDWIAWGDTFDDGHPNVPGSLHISQKMTAWLKNWGVQPQNRWATPV